jgi:hypothetical protein
MTPAEIVLKIKEENRLQFAELMWLCADTRTRDMSKTEQQSMSALIERLNKIVDETRNDIAEADKPEFEKQLLLQMDCYCRWSEASLGLSVEEKSCSRPQCEF